MVKFIFASLAIALFLLIPNITGSLDARLPLEFLWRIPNTGLNYLCTFFHELGHTAIRWWFGQPAIPTFDFVYGGGMTYDFERSSVLLVLVYVLMLAGTGWLWKNDYRALVPYAMGLIILHAAIAFNEGHDVVMLFMGAGAEVLVGLFCLYRAVVLWREGSKVERWLNAVFGFFALGRNIWMCLELAASDVARIAYHDQKGGHGFGDLSRIGELMGVQVESVAFSLLFIFLFLSVLTGYMIWCGRTTQINP